MSGEAEADETLIGGKARNMHEIKRIRKYVAGELAHGGAGKAIEMGFWSAIPKRYALPYFPEIKKATTDEQIRTLSRGPSSTQMKPFTTNTCRITFTISLTTLKSARGCLSNTLETSGAS